MTSNGYRVSFYSDGNVLNCVDGCKLWAYTKKLGLMVYFMAYHLILTKSVKQFNWIC